MGFKGLDTSDYVVGQVWGRLGASFVLMAQTRARMDYPATLAAIRQMSRDWSGCVAKLIEDKANGSAVIQMLQYEIPGIIPVNPEGGKVARASAVSPLIEAGNVYLPHPQREPWVLDFIEECATFPNGAHDDQVDAMTQALLRAPGAIDLLRLRRIRSEYHQPHLSPSVFGRTTLSSSVRVPVVVTSSSRAHLFSQSRVPSALCTSLRSALLGRSWLLQLFGLVAFRLVSLSCTTSFRKTYVDPAYGPPPRAESPPTYRGLASTDLLRRSAAYWRLPVVGSDGRNSA
ncbi:MAG: phage terminase large subunit [Acidobacteriota bacterium]